MIPMWAPFLFLAFVCLVCPRPAHRCLCEKGRRCLACIERDGLTKGKP